MKKLLKNSVCLLFGIALLFSCNNEDDTVSLSDLTPEVIGVNTPLGASLADIATGSSSAGNCISINYPVTVNGYNANLELLRSYVITSDADFISFAEGLDQNGSYAIQYPISITGYNSEIIEVNSNAGLLSAVQTELAECEANSCEVQNTVFRQLFAQLVSFQDPANGIVSFEENTMDAFTHEYAFSFDVDGTICSIGYQGEDRPVPAVYLVELVDEDNTVLYSGSHTFSTSETEYISIPSVAITAGRTYIVRRSIASYAVGSGVGRMAMRQQNQNHWENTLPFTHGSLTIHYSRFYGGGGSEQMEYFFLPFIDLVFKPS